MKKLTIICLLALANITAFAAVPPSPAPPAASAHEPSVTCTWISFMPVILVATTIFICLIGLKNSDVSFSSLFAEKDITKTTPPAVVAPVVVPPAVAAPAVAPPVAAGIPADPPPASTSRFMLFLTGLTALILASCMTTFFMYQYFTDPTKPADLSNLNTVIFGLGIGVIPYGFNKISSGIKSN